MVHHPAPIPAAPRKLLASRLECRAVDLFEDKNNEAVFAVVADGSRKRDLGSPPKEDDINSRRLPHSVTLSAPPARPA